MLNPLFKPKNLLAIIVWYNKLNTDINLFAKNKENAQKNCPRFRNSEVL